ncbi:MAG: sigma-54-dependent Fis family transcriptional regulator [Proteobacteria bacterium]|nr:sigma-54-dependent Fis family transcriptional regulator [Pseudomonadota bacterium]
MSDIWTTLSQSKVSDGSGSSEELVRRCYLVLVMECERPAFGSARYDITEIGSVLLTGGPRRHSATSSDGRALVIDVPDRCMSAPHARIVKRFGHWLIENAGSKNGTYVGRTQVARHRLSDGDIIRTGRTLFLFRNVLVTGEPGSQLGREESENDPITMSAAFAGTLQSLGRVAEANLPVLLIGESGTGKEVLARAVHYWSGRSGPFVAVNCGAIPQELAESMFFGHRRGAFSGATDDSDGYVRAAHGGTLFLDEIGDLRPSVQTVLLRTLQEREVTPVGESSPIPVDFHLNSATHQDLEGLVAAGHFRHDLWARISGYVIHLPPLRERREDIGFLYGQFLRREGANNAISLSTALQLLEYPWPANVRELRNVTRRAVVLAGTSRVHSNHLPAAVTSGSSASSDGASAAVPVPDCQSPEWTDEDQERREQLVTHLHTHDGNVSAVARAMGKDRRQIHRWLKRYDLKPADFSESRPK